ncbi:hypothetical protein Taro_008766 [Colocasia esculenta]|uniref:Uncharacterized protein n=1 Tax=Colocasia esculenta TaxID=4460 RepID=A0A843TZ40_COLES|nr:hypothetical protein [Colocasia esculenta]
MSSSFFFSLARGGMDTMAVMARGRSKTAKGAYLGCSGGRHWSVAHSIMLLYDFRRRMRMKYLIASMPEEPLAPIPPPAPAPCPLPPPSLPPPSAPFLLPPCPLPPPSFPFSPSSPPFVPLTHNLCTFTTGSRPMTSAPLPPAAGRLMASASPSHMASRSTPPPSEPVHADDETSHHEGEGSYETMRAVWINEGYRNHRFTEHSDGLRARSAWTTTARANFKHLMYNVRRNTERVCASTDKNQWKEHGPVWMRKEYWIELCDIWGAEKWNENSAKAKQNRAAHPEANVHTSGSVSFATHKVRLEVQLKRPPQFQELFDETHKKKGTNDYISEKAREVAESYSRGMDERYEDETSGAPKKGHVYGFGHSMGTARVISSYSSSVSYATSPFTTPTAPGGSSSATPTMTPDLFREIVNETVSQNISTIVSQTDHPSRDVGRDDDQDDTYAEDL